ncbi:MAG: DUF4157 domain-containing protein, partial [Saprospiraceae bacterium]
MESRMGQDFSQVRVHTGAQAAESAAAVQARAYTSGQDVVFGAGEYQPGSESGKRLLAHELVHVGQQRHGASGMLQRKVGDVVLEIEKPLDTIDQNVFYLSKNYEILLNQVLTQVLVVQGTSAVLYNISYNDNGPSKTKLASYVIRPLDLPPMSLLSLPDGKFGIVSVSETELANQQYSPETVLLGKKLTSTPEERKIYEGLDKELNLPSWFPKKSDFTDFSAKSATSGFAVVIMPAGGSKSGGGGGTGAEAKPPMPAWMRPYQEKVRESIQDKKKLEPDAKDLPDAFAFYYSRSFKRYRATASKQQGTNKEPTRAYLEVAEDNPVEETVERIRTKLRIKELSAFQETPKENADSQPVIQESEVWALELLLLLRKKISEDKKISADRYDRPDEVHLVTVEDQPGTVFLSLSVSLLRTQVTGEEFREKKTARLGDPLRKGMTVDNLWEVVTSAAAELREDRQRIQIDPAKEREKYKKVKAPYPAKIIPLDTRSDFIAVKGGLGNYEMRIDYSEYEGTSLVNLTVANMQTVYFRWITLPTNLFLDDAEKKAVAEKTNWEERRALLVQLFKHKSMRRNSPVKLKAPPSIGLLDLALAPVGFGIPLSSLPQPKVANEFVVDWQRDSVGESTVPNAEGDYVVYCEAFFPARDGVFRLPSEAFFPVHAVDGYKLAQEAVDLPDKILADKERELLTAQTSQAGAERIAELQAELAGLRDKQQHSMLTNTKQTFADFERQLRYAGIIRKQLEKHPSGDIGNQLLQAAEPDIDFTPLDLWNLILKEDKREVTALEKVDWAIYRLEEQRNQVKGIIDRAGKFEGEIRDPQYSPRTSFISDGNGQAYNLLMILAESNEHRDYYRTEKRGFRQDVDYIEKEIPNRTVMVLVDVTTEATQRKYKGISDNPDKSAARLEATRRAYQAFGEKAVYGTGYVHYKVPGMIEDGVNIRSTPGTWE